MIFRRQHTANFTTISNRLFDDERLEADEMGILAYLLSRPNNWEVRRPALQRRFKVGVVAMRRIMRGWMKTGWCQATKVRLPNGHFCILYDIFDAPGRELSEDEVTEALSLVSSEASGIASSPESSPIINSNNDDQPEGSSSTCGSPVAGDMQVAYIRDITNTDLPNTDLQKSERELARAREKHAFSLAEFKRRWPDIANDDQVKVDNAWFALDFEEGDAALAGIVPFLDGLRRKGKKHNPASWNYLLQKRWTLLEAANAASKPALTTFALDSPEARALATLHDIAGKIGFFHSVMRRPAGVTYGRPVTPQIAALAQSPHRTHWVQLDHRQAGAWEELLRETLTVQARAPLRDGSMAPWPWPPKKDGTIYTDDDQSPDTSEDSAA